MITAAQLRAARALLGIDQRELADIAGLSVPTIQRMEASEGVIRGNVDSLMKLISALQGAGLELIGEGAVSTDEDIVRIKRIRKATKLLIALGDCAVTGNVTSMRNPFGIDGIMDRAYDENATIQKQRPSAHLPVLLDRVCPLHEIVKVDVHVPGCPPPADAIWAVVTELLAGRTPDVAALTRFGR